MDAAHISVCRAVGPVQCYLAECLGSITKCLPTAEILLGLDGFNETLGYCQNLARKYPNTKLYSSSCNVGPYAITNSLVRLAENDVFLVFGADDIMLSSIAQTISSYTGGVLILKERPFGDVDKANPLLQRENWLGSMICDKTSFHTVGGYKPIRYSGDTLFIRGARERGLLAYDEPVTYLYRIHGGQLTQSVPIDAPERLQCVADSYSERLNELTLTRIV